jgi:endonuclease-3 related protein
MAAAEPHTSSLRAIGASRGEGTSALPAAGVLLEAHDRLLVRYDIDRWHWTDDTPAYDICLGAILVQHTAWTNVEKALDNLRAAGIDSIEALHALDEDEVAVLIRPSGTPLVKAKRLRSFTNLVIGCGGFAAVFDRPPEELRQLLLSTHGIGPETADVICLYAARHPVVVHDAYTARLCRRLGIGPEGNAYETWRTWLDATLPAAWAYRARNHAAIVVHCKETCRVKPKCGKCPLAEICAFHQASLTEGS